MRTWIRRFLNFPNLVVPNLNALLNFTSISWWWMLKDRYIVGLPWNEVVAVVDDGLWSMLSIAAVENRPILLRMGGQTNPCSRYLFKTASPNCAEMSSTRSYAMLRPWSWSISSRFFACVIFWQLWQEQDHQSSLMFQTRPIYFLKARRSSLPFLYASSPGISAKRRSFSLVEFTSGMSVTNCWSGLGPLGHGVLC